MKITTELLKSLEFQYNEIDDSYYWTLNLSESNLSFCLLSNISDEVQDDNWNISLLEVEDCKFNNAELLIEFINIIKKIKNESSRP